MYIGGFPGGIDSQAAARFMLNRYDAVCVVLVNSDAGENEHPLTIEHIGWYSENVHPSSASLRIEVWPMRVSSGCNRTASLFAARAGMHRERIEGFANRTRLLRIERKLKTAFEAAERMFRVRVFLADYIKRQFVVLNDLHARILSRWRAA
jgi:hypothetical protein